MATILRAMTEKTLFKALFSAARIAAQTMVMSPAKAKNEIARRSVLAAAQVVNRDLSKAAGRAAVSVWNQIVSGKSSEASFSGLLKQKSQGRGGGRSGQTGRR